MAHRILGIDIGSYSVKVAVVRAGLRQTSVEAWYERPIPTGEAPVEQRALDTLAEMIREHRLDHDIPHLSLPGDVVSLRVLEFPFVSIKKPDLEKAIGGELEGQLPHDLEELVYSFDMLPKDDAAAKQGINTRVLAAACPREKMSALLTALAERQIGAHSIIAAPTAYARVLGKLDPALETQAVLVVDIGHTRTNACVVQNGRAVFGRTLSRGGRHVTQAIARGWRLDEEEAERTKHTHGRVVSPGDPDASAEWMPISNAIKPELEPLVQGLRQTLAASRAKTGVTPTRVVLCGGGSRLAGITAYIQSELDLPVTPASEAPAARVAGPQGTAELPVELCPHAFGIALEAASGRPAFDLRQGPFAYKTDFSFLRKRAGFLVACGLALVAFAAGNAYAALYQLKKEGQLLDKRIASDSQEIFGKPLTLAALEEQLHPKKEGSPLPKMTAFDLLVEISRKLPEKGAIKLDVMELEIEPKKLYLKVVVDNEQSADAAEKKLKEITCFEDVKRGNVDTVSDGKQLTWTITNKCM
jgi:type IV pilus assembly protein PilM